MSFFVTKENFEGLMNILEKRGGKITIEVPKPEVKIEYSFPKHPIFPVRPLFFDDRSLKRPIDVTKPHGCSAGCHEDDRGFVVVNNCPIHSKGSGDGVAGD